MCVSGFVGFRGVWGGILTTWKIMGSNSLKGSLGGSFEGSTRVPKRGFFGFIWGSLLRKGAGDYFGDPERHTHISPLGLGFRV